MKNITMEQSIDHPDLTKIFRQLSNSNKRTLIQYLQMASFATATVIVRRCNLKQPTVSRYLRSLVDASLISREKVGTQVLYQVNKQVFLRVCILLGGDASTSL